MVGKVIGAGSFGVVREAVQRGTGIRYAVKSVPKMPKRGVATPRYLLKLRQEVDAMQQLGASLDAVYLAVRFAQAHRLRIYVDTLLFQTFCVPLPVYTPHSLARSMCCRLSKRCWPYLSVHIDNYLSSGRWGVSWCFPCALSLRECFTLLLSHSHFLIGRPLQAAAWP